MNLKQLLDVVDYSIQDYLISYDTTQDIVEINKSKWAPDEHRQVYISLGKILQFRIIDKPFYLQYKYVALIPHLVLDINVLQKWKRASW